MDDHADRADLDLDYSQSNTFYLSLSMILMNLLTVYSVSNII